MPIRPSLGPWRGRRLPAVFALAAAIALVVWFAQERGERHTITGTAADSALELSLDSGDYVRDAKTVLAAAADADARLSLRIDGKEADLLPVMRQPAVLSFEADGLEAGDGYQDSVWVNGKLAAILDRNLVGFAKAAVVIPAEMLQSGANTVALRAGNLTSPDSEAGNHDDWRFRALTFTLADGTVLEDPDYRTAAVYTVGDEPNALQRQWTFVIKDDKYRTSYYKWDTRSVADGSHAIELSASMNDQRFEKRITVQVDNTPPKIGIVSPVDGRTYKNRVALNAEASDAGSGSTPVVAKLDGTVLQLPVTLETSGLAKGTHRLEVIAADKAGNETTATVGFRVNDEIPDPPSLSSPADRAVVASAAATLRVAVRDPADSELDVAFYKAARYDLGGAGQARAYAGAADREPPALREPDGETPFSPADRALVAAPDGKYLTNDAKEKFPYHRFSFEAGNAPPADLEAVWTGHSLPGRLVTLYAWNNTKAAWEELASGQGAEDFTLRGRIKQADMVQDGKVDLLVQDRIPAADEYDYAFVWMSDTQYYAESFPAVYDTMTAWVAGHWKDNKFRYLIHTGDIVNNWNSKTEWERASSSMKILDDAHIPYGVVTGNHDVAFDAGNYEMFWKYFGRDRFAAQPTFGGDLNNYRDHYDLVSAAGNDFVIVYLGWLIDDKSFAWANAVLRQYADRNAIIATHEYLKPNHAYFGQGQAIWDRLVTPNPNVFLVLGGHNPGTAYNVKSIGDRTVLEMLSDYQNGPQGGEGFMRLLKFDVQHGKLYVNSYSPLLQKWNFFKKEEDEFELPLKLQPIDKRVATDYIAVNARTTEPIGSAQRTPSGGTASVAYAGLQQGTTYGWYAVVKDPYGGQNKSDVWTFRRE
ncbi:metallophosphoesterase [Paenibacillus cymbidii]|uniref:metallophosphoesterase n=1 Tax=Paenibacillus cymbidii TaxID=1639034 RepID=UPI001082213A|nr:metallophosphoesterase [Paenibacillus cymbidii]